MKVHLHFPSFDSMFLPKLWREGSLFAFLGHLYFRRTKILKAKLSKYTQVFL